MGFQNYDVMISYSTKKKKIAEDITAMLNDNGYNVWIAPISIPNGGDYVDEIYAAIENSRIVLFILSEESLNSKWCQNELVYAVKLNKKVLPVQVAEVIDPYNKLGKINYVLQRKQILDLFPLYKERLNEIIEDIEKLLNDKGLKHNPYPQNSYEFDDDVSLLVGRDTEVNEINDALGKHHIINLHGMGGIGKTSVIKKYFTTYLISGAYKSIHIAKYINNLKQTIAHIPFVGFDELAYLDSIKDPSILKEDALFDVKINMLNNCANECLLVIDGINDASDDEINILKNISIKTILTSRRVYRNTYSYEIKPLANNYLVELFLSISKIDFTDDEISAINSILAEIGNHTLTTKLIASYAYDLGMSAKEILAEGVLDSLFEYDNQEEQISSLLDNYKLDDLDVYALRCLALFPDGISKGKFQLIDRRLLRHYPDLVKRGLVIGSDTGYQLHQIIREIVAKKFKISTKDISSFLEAFLKIFRYIGFTGNELEAVMRNMDSIITGDDYLMANMFHLFGNAFCDMGYSNFFHVSHATYQSQDMNFYNQKNVNCAYYDKFNYSLKLNKKALAVASKIEDGKSLIPYIYSYIGSTNFNMNNYENAVKYQRLGLEAAVKYLPEGDFAHMVILNRLGLSAIEINDLDTALEAFLEYQRVANKLNLDVNHAMNLFNLGNIYYLKKDYEKAKEYYFKSEDMLEDDKETSFGYSELCFMLAQIYLVENNKECAIKYYLISKEIKKRVIIDEDVLNKFIEYYDKIFL